MKYQWRFLFKKYAILTLLLLFCFVCKKTNLQRNKENKEIYLPTEKQITQVLQSKSDYRVLNDFAISKGFKNAKEYHTKLVSEIDDEELQSYYNKYKPSGLENLGVYKI